MFSLNLLLSYHLVQVNSSVLDVAEELLLLVLCHQKAPNSIPEMVVDPLNDPSQMEVQQIYQTAVVGPKHLSLWVMVDLMVV
jgi:hypothetical protein